MIMDKRTANKILGFSKSLYKDVKNLNVYYHGINLPSALSTLPFDDEFLVALLLDNRDTFDRWGKLNEDEIIIPTLKTYDIVTKWVGTETVSKTYSNRVEAYSEAHLEDMINDCDPCYDEGDEVDVVYFDSDGQWEFESVEQITEEDINRLVKKILK